MRVLLVSANPNQSVPVSPYGLDVIRATLELTGVAAETLTVNPFIEDVEPMAHLARVLAAFQPDLIGISIRNIDNAIVVLSDAEPADGAPTDLVAYAPAIRDLVAVIRAWNPEVPCVAGGAGFTSCPAELLDYLGLDLGLIGAAEVSFAQLAGRLAEPRRPDLAVLFAELAGAVYRDGDHFRRVPVRPTLAGERWHWPSLAPEYEVLYRLRGIPVAVRTKAGCPLRCSYCTDPVNMRQTDVRPLGNVFDDLAHYVDERGLNRFHIADAELNLPYEEHLLRFCRGLVERGLADRIRWRGYFNVIPFSDELVDAVVAAGCRSPSFAVDSFTSAGLKGHQKNFREHHAHDVLSRFLARGSDIQPEICLLLGQPGETRQSVDTNIGWMLHYADRGAQVAYSCGLRVYPNTPLARAALDRRHVYAPPGRRLPDGLRLAPRDLVEPVVYCEPLPPRELARYVAERVGQHPRIGIFSDGPWPEARHGEALRHFNVGVHRLAHARFDEARTHFDGALSRCPGLAPARVARRLTDGVAAPA